MSLRGCTWAVTQLGFENIFSKEPQDPARESGELRRKSKTQALLGYCRQEDIQNGWRARTQRGCAPRMRTSQGEDVGTGQFDHSNGLALEHNNQRSLDISEKSTTWEASPFKGVQEEEYFGGQRSCSGPDSL